ncbi:SprT-like domain-containing protein [Niabella ginsengisoli]|uniref:SprT-like domain-containing protein n=1 Tax=Niabella ginsengisoli TaxID=522298 RepID=A0ABS9SQQ0_9BACT|nr:SprT-like domain-containing protein [Niabella ginsengisoli]MCH5600684.1 SprT-like domain-containing protein [Niabella ginsengisoli]
MPKKEVPLPQLAQYLPENTYEPVIAFLNFYKVHLTIAKSRNSVLGDYRHSVDTKHHRISVNGNLNKYAFLITLLHELAHLITFEKYGNKIQAHGKEWKTIYGQVLAQFIEKKIFPTDIEYELLRTLHNPGASTCSEESLQRILYKYDPKKEGHSLVEDLPEGAFFRLKDGRVFQKGKRRTKRYSCLEVSTNKTYLFSPVYEVMIVGS